MDVYVHNYTEKRSCVPLGDNSYFTHNEEAGKRGRADLVQTVEWGPIFKLCGQRSGGSTGGDADGDATAASPSPSDDAGEGGFQAM